MNGQVEAQILELDAAVRVLEQSQAVPVDALTSAAGEASMAVAALLQDRGLHALVIVTDGDRFQFASSTLGPVGVVGLTYRTWCLMKKHFCSF